MRIRRGLGAVLAGVLAAAALGGAASAATTLGFDPAFGGPLGGGDDAGAQVDLPFAVSLFGQSFSTMNISTNGYVTLTNLSGIDGLDLSADTWNPNVAGFLSEQARIAPEWFDWVSDFYYDTSESGRVMVTWVGTQYGGDATHTAQLQIFSDGTIVFAYDDPTAPNGNVLSGVTTGNGAGDPGASDFVGSSFAVSGVQAIYSFGGSFANNVPVTFTPDGHGGYSVVGGVPPLPDPVGGGGDGGAASAVPEPAAWALMLIGFGGLGAMLRRGRGRGAYA